MTQLGSPILHLVLRLKKQTTTKPPSYTPPFQSTHTIHDIAEKVEKSALRLISDIREAIKEIKEINLLDLSLEALLLGFEKFEQELSDKGIDLATSLLLVTDLIRLTIENARRTIVDELGVLEHIELRAKVIALLAGWLAKETQHLKDTRRHTLGQKPALTF